jgi:hypothetical protein
MGGGGGKTKQAAAPPQAEPLNVSAIMGAASAGASAQVREQYKSLIENYPQMEALSFGTVGRLAGYLGDKPTPIYDVVEKKDKRGNVTGYERKQVGMSEPNRQTVDALARIRQALALGDRDPNMADPTSIEQGLYDAGERELALGRSLSPEQEREAQQATRTAFAARGLGTGLSSATAEVMNRDAMASNRERERQSFASQQNSMLMGNVMGRRGALADLYTAGAGNLIAADPYSRAVGPGLGLAGQQQGNMMQMSGRTFDSANQLAGTAALANAQMQEGRYNSFMNNQAAMQAARMSSGASRQAGMFGLIGGIGGGALAGGGAALGAYALAGASF